VSAKHQESGYFLVCPQLKTIRLSYNQPMTIGREKYNDIVLNDLLVSRQHTLIQWEKDHFTIKDLKSRNGTYVNSERIEFIPLKDGDAIKVGSYDFTLRAASQVDIERTLLQERVRMSSQETLVDSDLGIRFNEKGFSGNLSTLALIEVVQTLSQCLKTGLLVITPPDNAVLNANLYFEDGDIVHAEYGNQTSLPAVMQILKMSEGQFEFKNDLAAPERTVQQTTMSILLEACRLRDEAHRQQTNQ
jgi:pSer/pThr/pTyr-binding forkhead associated (FHA) protein